MLNLPEFNVIKQEQNEYFYRFTVEKKDQPYMCMQCGCVQFIQGGGMEWSEKHFPGRGKGIDPQKVYSWEEEFSFHAGSYRGYNWWRSKLEKFKGDEAFQELINFADNEGVIGFVVSKKLAVDFAKYEEEAKEFSKTLGENGEYWLNSYHDWKKAFEIATDNGAVDFH